MKKKTPLPVDSVGKNKTSDFILMGLEGAETQRMSFEPFKFSFKKYVGLYGFDLILFFDGSVQIGLSS